jgi:predicted TIM-barrel fold metal-dependent hydrolase
MTRALRLCAILLALPGAAVAQAVADHHQHLFSPTLAPLISLPSITAADLVRHLDAAGIRRAVVLSTAYLLASPARKLANERDAVMADNDWTASQVGQFPDRLVGFCGVNPLTDYAIEEIARCAKNVNLRRGLKLHFGNSVVDYQNPTHIEQLRRVFRAANDHGMAIVVHMRVNTNAKLSYGRAEALTFINELLAAAPDITVQIGHLAGAGGYEYPLIDPVLDVFAEAIGKKDPRVARVWFDVTAVASAKTTPERAKMIVQRIRQLGVERILYGSDAPASDDALPRARWAAFRALPLTEAEIQAIAANVAPYLR